MARHDRHLADAMGSLRRSRGRWLAQRL